MTGDAVNLGIIEGSPKNSTSSVPIMPWGSDSVEHCADWVDK